MAVDAGETQLAIQTLSGAADYVDERKTKLDSTVSRVALQEAAWEIYDAWLRIESDRGQSPEKLFALAERARSTWLHGNKAVTRPSLDEVRSSIDGTTVLAYFVMCDDRLLTWTITSDVAHHVVRRVSRSRVDWLVERYRAAIARGDGSDAMVGGELRDMLLDDVERHLGVGSRLVIIPDGSLGRLPFAALVNAHTGRYLIEDSVVSVAPSAALAVRRRHTTASAGPAVLVAAAHSGGGPWLQLADEEAKRVGALYSSKRVLAGAQATADEFLRALPGAGMVHFAGHARQNGRLPWESRLFLTSAPDDDGVVTAKRLSTLDLSRIRLVVGRVCQVVEKH